MKHIEASTKVTGKRREASINAAMRKVRDDEVYLICRHGGYFRPGAHGYTSLLWEAGIFTGVEARHYLSVEGLSLVPLPSARKLLERRRDEALESARSYGILLQLAVHGKNAPGCKKTVVKQSVAG